MTSVKGPEQVSLQFHARTFEMAGAPALVNAAVRLLAERERECGLTFPASVREWYVFDGPGLGPKVGCGPTGDTMVPVRDLGRAFSDWFPEHDDPAKPHRLDDYVQAGLLVVMLENQGVCTWAVKLDGSDDPPVVVEVDSRRSAASPSEVRWEPCAGSFSTFMYCRAWDQGCCLTDTLVMAFAHDRALAPGDLELLQSHFSEGPRTHGHPGATNYRFFTGNSTILIWDGEDNEGRGGQADWRLTPLQMRRC